MICEECGRELPEQVKFCGYCGYHKDASAANEAPDAGGTPAANEAPDAGGTPDANETPVVGGISAANETPDVGGISAAVEAPVIENIPEADEKPSVTAETVIPETAAAAPAAEPPPRTAVVTAEKPVRFCGVCGAEIAGKFCVICGKSADDAAAPPVTPPPVANVGSIQEKPQRRKKKRGRLFAYLLVFILLIGVLSGMWGAYYVAGNGWESVPFAEKLTFIPFVKTGNEKTETYQVPAVIDESEETGEKDDGGAEETESLQEETENPAEMTDQPDESPEASPEQEPVSPEEMERIIIGDWIGAHSAGYAAVRLSSDGVASGIIEERDENGELVQATAFFEPYEIREGILTVGSQSFGSFNFTDETLEILFMDETMVLNKTNIRNTGLQGLWHGIGADEYLLLEFYDSITGRVVDFSETPIVSVEFQYSYDDTNRLLVLTPEENAVLTLEMMNIEIIGEYLLIASLGDHGEAALLRKTNGGN